MAGAFTEARPSWARRTLFIGSIGFHGVAAVAGLIWSVLHVEELPPPEVMLTFFNAPPPPPPPPPPAGAQQQQKKPQTKPKIVPVKTSSLKEPVVKQKDEPKEEKGGGETGGVQGGVAGGVAGGVVGGVVGAPPTAAPPPPPPPQATKMVPSFVFDKERISSPDPHLPDDFKDHHPKQTLNATYRICVGTDGRINEASVVRGIGGIDDAILRQVRSTWVYKPQPVPVCSMRVFVFKIN